MWMRNEYLGAFFLFENKDRQLVSYLLKLPY